MSKYGFLEQILAEQDLTIGIDNNLTARHSSEKKSDRKNKPTINKKKIVANWLSDDNNEVDLSSIIDFGKGVLTIRKLAKISGISYGTLRKFVADGRLKKIRIPYSCHIRYSPIQLARIVVENNLPSNNGSWHKKSGYVYFLAGGGYIKIGKTKNLKLRKEMFDIQLPFQCDIIHKIRTNDCKRLEDEFHEKFASKRTNGEWFSLSDDDLIEVRKNSTIKY